MALDGRNELVPNPREPAARTVGPRVLPPGRRQNASASRFSGCEIGFSASTTVTDFRPEGGVHWRFLSSIDAQSDGAEFRLLCSVQLPMLSTFPPRTNSVAGHLWDR